MKYAVLLLMTLPCFAAETKKSEADEAFENFQIAIDVCEKYRRALQQVVKDQIELKDCFNYFLDEKIKLINRQK